MYGLHVRTGHSAYRCSGKFVAPENYSHTQQYGLGLRLRIGLNLGLGLGLGIGLRLGLGLGLELRLGLELGLGLALVTFMTIWKWEEFFRCDKFPTTPGLRGFDYTAALSQHFPGLLH